MLFFLNFKVSRFNIQKLKETSSSRSKTEDWTQNWAFFVLAVNVSQSRLPIVVFDAFLQILVCLSICKFWDFYQLIHLKKIICLFNRHIFIMQ